MHVCTRIPCAVLAAASLGFGLDLDVAHAAPSPELFPESPLTQLLAEGAGAARGTVQRLSLATEPGQSTRFSAVLGGEEVEIQLLPWSDRAEDCSVLVVRDGGVIEEVDLPPSRTWRGYVTGDPSRMVAATIDDQNRVTATIRDEVDGRSWAIQPVTGFGGAFDDWSIAYARTDALPHDGRCGSDHTDVVNPGMHDRPPVAAADGGAADPLELGGPERLDIAFAADFEYYQANGSSVAATVQDIETVMNSVGLNYQNQLGISYRTTGFVIWTTSADPYSSTSSSGRLCEFRLNWNVVNYHPKDTAHLFTGVDLDGDVIGRAYIGALCNVTDGNCDGGSSSYGMSQSTFSTNMTERVILTMHELGHNWNACHCNQTQCTGGGSDGDCGVMESNVGNGSTTFGSRSTATIQTYRVILSCLSPAYNPVFVNANWGGPQNGSSAFPFDTALEGIWAVPVGGTVSFSSGAYPQNLTIVRPMVLQPTGSGSAVLGQ